MTCSKNKTGLGKIFFGLIFILIGLGILADHLNLFNNYSFSFKGFFITFWPLVLVFLGIFLLFKRSYIAAMVISFLGIFFQLSQIYTWDIWRTWWPLLLVLIGLLIIFGRSKSHYGYKMQEVAQNYLEEDVSFSGVKKRVMSDKFKGGYVKCSFGEIKIDLTKIQLSKQGAKLEIDCNFADVEIIVPKTIAIQVDGTTSFGAFEDKTSQTVSDGPLLKITGRVSFGGVEIMN